MQNIKLTIAYSGTHYHGWQRQQNVRATVQEVLEEAIARATGIAVSLRGSGRTDTGVHAAGQAANFFVASPIPAARMRGVINRELPGDIRIVKSEGVGDEFDAIGSSRSKLYRYTVYLGRTAPVAMRERCWSRGYEIDVPAMERASSLLIGEHDFASFASVDKNSPEKSTVRELYRCQVYRKFDVVYFDLEGSGFLYHMVRNIVGTLVEVGRGHWRAERVREVLTAGERTAAGPMAPAAGLCLQWVRY